MHWSQWSTSAPATTTTNNNKKSYERIEKGKKNKRNNNGKWSLYFIKISHKLLTKRLVWLLSYLHPEQKRIQFQPYAPPRMQTCYCRGAYFMVRFSVRQWQWCVRRREHATLLVWVFCGGCYCNRTTPTTGGGGGKGGGGGGRVVYNIVTIPMRHLLVPARPWIM